MHLYRQSCDRPAIASGLMRVVTIKSDSARLAMKTRPELLPVVSARWRRSRRCFIATVVMTTTLPTVPTTAATPSTATYGPAISGRRLYNEPSVSELFASSIKSCTSGNSIVLNYRPTPTLLISAPTVDPLEITFRWTDSNSETYLNARTWLADCNDLSRWWPFRTCGLIITNSMQRIRNSNDDEQLMMSQPHVALAAAATDWLHEWNGLDIRISQTRSACTSTPETNGSARQNEAETVLKVFRFSFISLCERFLTGFTF